MPQIKPEDSSSCRSTLCSLPHDTGYLSTSVQVQPTRTPPSLVTRLVSQDMVQPQQGTRKVETRLLRTSPGTTKPSPGSPDTPRPRTGKKNAHRLTRLTGHISEELTISTGQMAGFWLWRHIRKNCLIARITPHREKPTKKAQKWFMLWEQ